MEFFGLDIIADEFPKGMEKVDQIMCNDGFGKHSHKRISFTSNQSEARTPTRRSALSIPLQHNCRTTQPPYRKSGLNEFVGRN